MNTFRKTLATLLTLTIIFSSFNLSYCINEDWSGQAIADFLYNEIDAPDVMQDEKYSLYITREDFAQLILASYCKISEIERSDIPLSPNKFNDTESEDVSRAYYLGIVKGNENGCFNPKDNITREETATILVRFLNLLKIDTSYSIKMADKFKDTNNISSWAYDSMSYCSENDIIRGGNNNLFPKEYSTTEQLIVMIHRLMKKYDWIESVDYKYISSMKVPSDSQLSVRSDGVDGWTIEILWNNVKDSEIIKNDLTYVFLSRFQNITEEELDYAVNEIMKTRENISIDKNENAFFLSSMYNYRIYITTINDRAMIFIHTY